MLGKLLKYELKRSARKFFPLVVGYMIVALIFSLMLRYGESVKSPNFLVIFIVVCIAYGIAVGALFTVGFTISLTNFHKTLFTDEGYLMLTIPVSHIITFHKVHLFCYMVGGKHDRFCAFAVAYRPNRVS